VTVEDREGQTETNRDRETDRNRERSREQRHRDRDGQTQTAERDTDIDRQTEIVRDRQAGRIGIVSVAILGLCPTFRHITTHISISLPFCLLSSPPRFLLLFLSGTHALSLPLFSSPLSFYFFAFPVCSLSYSLCLISLSLCVSFSFSFFFSVSLLSLLSLLSLALSCFLPGLVNSLSCLSPRPSVFSKIWPWRERYPIRDGQAETETNVERDRDRDRQRQTGIETEERLDRSRHYSAGLGTDERWTNGNRDRGDRKQTCTYRNRQIQTDICKQTDTDRNRETDRNRLTERQTN